VAERDKWARIPATVYEVQQDFCALEWGELPCQAGPQSNVQIYSRLFGDSVIWSTTGTVSDVSFTGVDETNGLNQEIALDVSGTEVVFVPVANRNLLPTFEDRKSFYGSFYYREGTSVTSLTLGLTFTDADGEISVVGFDCDSTTETASAIDPAVSDIQFETGSLTDSVFGFTYTRVTFAVDSTQVVAAGKAYSVFIEFQAIAGSGSVTVTLPQISIDEVTDYRQTEDDVILAGDQPCFNTLSSCQATQTYTIEGLNDAARLYLGSSAEYAISNSGSKNEGVYVEFYYGRGSGG